MRNRSKTEATEIYPDRSDPHLDSCRVQGHPGAGPTVASAVGELQPTRATNKAKSQRESLMATDVNTMKMESTVVAVFAAEF